MNEADPRVKRTRKLLTDAFVELLGEKGFAALTVQDVAKRATVNRATFYAHYEDKYALLDAVIGGMFREQIGRALPPEAPFNAANLRGLVVAALGALADFHAHCRPTHRDLGPLIERRVQRELYERLLGWLRPPPHRTGSPVAPATAAAVASWAIFGAGVEYGRGGDRASAVARADEVLSVLLDGLAGAVGMPQDRPVRPTPEAVRAGA
jgi:AcrR family transcriptional regulator